MPTRITFTTTGSGPVTLDVAEDPDKVRGAFIGSAGLPFRLTDAAENRQVYINPPSVAFWRGLEVPEAASAERKRSKASR